MAVAEDGDGDGDGHHGDRERQHERGAAARRARPPGHHRAEPRDAHRHRQRRAVVEFDRRLAVAAGAAQQPAAARVHDAAAAVLEADVARVRRVGDLEAERVLVRRRRREARRVVEEDLEAVAALQVLHLVVVDARRRLVEQRRPVRRRVDGEHRRVRRAARLPVEGAAQPRRRHAVEADEVVRAGAGKVRLPVFGVAVGQRRHAEVLAGRRRRQARDRRDGERLEQLHLLGAERAPVLVQQPAERRVGVEAVVEEARLLVDEPLYDRALPRGVELVGEEAADAADDEGGAGELRHEAKVAAPQRRQVGGEGLRLEGGEHVLRRRRDVRRVHELRGVGELDAVLVHAHQVLAGREVGRLLARRRAGPRRHARALHQHEPARAAAEHVVADPLRRGVPVGRGVARRPRRAVRLLEEVDGEDVELAAQHVREHRPRAQHVRLGHLGRRPQPVARRVERRQPAADEGDEEAVLRGGDGDDAQRRRVRLAHEQRLHRRVEAAHLLAVEHRAVVEEEPHRVEAAVRDLFHVRVERVGVQPLEPARQVRRALAAPPRHALEVERRAVGRELAVGALEVDEVRWRGL